MNPLLKGLQAANSRLICSQQLSKFIWGSMWVFIQILIAHVSDAFLRIVNAEISFWGCCWRRACVLLQIWLTLFRHLAQAEGLMKEAFEILKRMPTAYVIRIPASLRMHRKHASHGLVTWDKSNWWSKKHFTRTSRIFLFSHSSESVPRKWRNTFSVPNQVQERISGLFTSRSAQLQNSRSYWSQGTWIHSNYSYCVRDRQSGQDGGNFRCTFNYWEMSWQIFSLISNLCLLVQ